MPAKKKTTSSKSKDVRHQKLIEKQANKLDPRTALKETPLRFIQPLIALYKLGAIDGETQELDAEGLATIMSLAGTTVKMSTASGYFTGAKKIGEKLKIPLIKPRFEGRRLKWQLTKEGADLVRHQLHRWNDCPTRATFQAMLEEKRNPNISPMREIDAALAELESADKSASPETPLDELDELEALEEGEIEMSSNIDPSELTKASLADRIKRLPPHLRRQVLKEITGQDAQDARQEGIDDEYYEDDSRMRRSFTSNMDRIIDKIIEMFMVKSMLGSFSDGQAQALPPNWQHVPQESELDRMMKFMSLMRQMEGAGSSEEKLEIIRREMQQQNQFNQQMYQMQSQLERLRDEMKNQGQDAQAAILNTAIQRMQSDPDRSFQWVQAMQNQQMQAQQAQMQHQAQLADAERQWQHQIEMLREEQRRKDAEYYNEQMAAMREEMRRVINADRDGGSGLRKKLEDVMETFIIDRIQNAGDSVVDSDERKLRILQEMVGQTMSEAVGPIGAAIGEAVKAGVQERVSRAQTEQAGAQIVSQLPSATPNPAALPVPQQATPTAAPPVNVSPPSILPRPVPPAPTSTRDPFKISGGIQTGESES